MLKEEKKVCNLFKPITTYINYENHSLPWAPHRLLRNISSMYVQIFLVTLSTRATLITFRELLHKDV